MTEEELPEDTLNSVDMMDDNPLTLLYQSGYLTIADCDKVFKTYRFNFPSREVHEGFVKYLVPFYTPRYSDKASFFISNFVKDVQYGKVEDFMRRLDAFFANGHYALMSHKEQYFHNAVYVFFTLM